MGKKSLFEPTIAPEEEKKDPVPEEGSDAENIKAAEAPEPESAPVEAAVAETPSAASDEPSSEKAVQPSAPKTQPSVQEIPFCANSNDGSLEEGVPPFDNDPLIETRSLITAVAVVCGLILIIFMGSMMNADNYYVKQGRGAVEIWKGDFTPGGKDRIMILPGAHWQRPLKTSYAKADVFPFVAAYYLEKAKMSAEAPLSEDFDRIAYYLDRVQTLYAEEQVEGLDSAISQIGKTIAEARILQASGEKAAVDLAQEKIKTIGRALTELMTLLAGEVQPEAAKDGH